MEWHTFPGREKARQALLSLAHDSAVQHLLLRTSEEKDRDEALKKNTVVLEEMSRQQAADGAWGKPSLAPSRSAENFGGRAHAHAQLKRVPHGVKYNAPLAPQPYFSRKPPKRPPTLEQMELDMKAWANVVDEREAAVHEGRMLEYDRARRAFERSAREAFEAGERGKLDQAAELQTLKEQQEAKLQSVEKRCLAALQEMQAKAQQAEEERDANIEMRKAQRGELASLHAKLAALEETLSSQTKAKVEVEALHLQAKRAGEAQRVEARDAQIEQVRRQCVRRGLHRDVAIGFEAWLELANAKAAAMARLDQAATRLRNGVKVSAFAQWASAWETWVREAHSAQLAASREESKASEVAELEKRHAAEAEKARAEAEALASAISKLSEEVAERERQLKERTEAHAAEVAELQKEMETQREVGKTTVDQIVAAREQVMEELRAGHLLCSAYSR